MAKAKEKYKDLIVPLIEFLPPLKQISLKYYLFVSNKRIIDVNNILTIVDKFFIDPLVESGKIEDDNYKFINESLFKFGGLDMEAEDHYVFVTITSLD